MVLLSVHAVVSFYIIVVVHDGRMGAACIPHTPSRGAKVFVACCDCGLRWLLSVQSATPNGISIHVHGVYMQANELATWVMDRASVLRKLVHERLR